MPPRERHFRAQRTARFYEIGSASPATRSLWVVCHGYGQLAGPFTLVLESLRDPARVIIAPEALSRFYLDDPNKRHGPASPVGASWMTREDRDHEIADYVEYLDALASALLAEIGGAVPVVAMGFSQGVATVSRWAALGKTPIHRLILWGGTLPVDLPAEPGARLFRGARVTMVAGRRDTVVPVEAVQRDRDALAERGVTADLLVHDRGHSLDSTVLRELADAQ